MTRRFTTVLLAVGLLLQGCTIQKQRHPRLACRTGRPSVVCHFTNEPWDACGGRQGIESTCRRGRVDSAHPAAPIEGIDGLFAPSFHDVEHPKLRSKEKMVRETCRSMKSSDDERESTSDPSMDGSSAWKRIFMGLLALALDVASVPVISLGFWYGSWALVMFIALGAGLLYVSWFAWLAAFPKFRSQVRKRRNWEAKQQKR